MVVFQPEKGKEYYYEYRGRLKKGVFLGSTPAWYMFENGDWIRTFCNLYTTPEGYNCIQAIVEGIKKDTHVPDAIPVPCKRGERGIKI